MGKETFSWIHFPLNCHCLFPTGVFPPKMAPDDAAAAAADDDDDDDEDFYTNALFVFRIDTHTFSPCIHCQHTHILIIYTFSAYTHSHHANILIMHTLLSCTYCQHAHLPMRPEQPNTATKRVEREPSKREQTLVIIHWLPINYLWKQSTNTNFRQLVCFT